jgi:hypothetical protein
MPVFFCTFLPFGHHRFLQQADIARVKFQTFLLAAYCVLASVAGLSSPVFGEGTRSGESRAAVLTPVMLTSRTFVLAENRGQWNVASSAGALLGVSTPLNGARLFVFERGLSIVHYGSDVASWDEVRGPRRGEQSTASILPSLQSYRIDLSFPGSSPSRTVLTDRRDGVQRWYVPGAPAEAEEAALFSGILFENLYPGVDLSCRLESAGIKYEFRVRPGADASRISMRYDGAGDASLRADGGLAFQHAAGTLGDDAPFVWQSAEEGGIEALDARWLLRDGSLGFHVSGRDASRPMVIDPFLQWSTFLGGTLSDYARDAVTDKQGTIFVCGYSASTDFPVSPGALQATSGGSFDVFVSAFSRERRQLWSTYFGGSASEESPRIAAAADGSLYIAGSTSSTDLPVTADALQPRNGGRYDVFLLSLDDKGRRNWATYFGGSYSDECGDLVVAPDGDIYVTGGTYSTNLPVTPDALQTSNNGDHDIFLARFSSKGTREWATYIGGWSMDFAASLALDRSGNIYLAGRTESTNLPGLTLERQSAYGGGSFDGFVMRVDGRQRRLDWSTYIGGEQEESVERIAIDSQGNIVLAATPPARSFPSRAIPCRKNTADWSTCLSPRWMPTASHAGRPISAGWRWTRPADSRSTKTTTF